MSSPDFILSHLVAKGQPEPAARFTGLPKHNFIGGHNDIASIPVEALAEAADAVLRREGSALAIYNLGHGPQGYRGLREFIVKKLATHRGITSIDADDVLITSGSGQGLDFINDLLVERGDTVIIEEFSYQSSIKRARKLGANVIGAPLDQHGIVVEKLEAILEDLKGKGITPKYIYTIPTVQNPTGSVLPLDRRLKLVELSRRYGVPIFEDECYADLTFFEGEAPPSFYALAPETTIHIGSFSKNLAPALRVGYVVAGWAVLGRLVATKSDGGTGAINQMVVAEYLGTRFESHMRALNGALERKLDVILDALDKEFGTAVEVSRPEGGIFVWITLPDSVDTAKLVKPAAAVGLSFNAGAEWAAEAGTDKGKSSMRLCFALPDEAQIREGVAVLARVCFEQTGIPVRSANVQQTARS